MEHKGYGLAFLAGVTWGTLGIISYYLGETGVGPFEIAFLRLLFAFLSMFIFYLITDRKKLKVKREEVKHSLLIGIITQGTMSLAIYKCISLTSTTVGVMMVCLGPLFTAILSRIFFKEKITLFKGLALTLAFYGAFLVVTGGDASTLQANVIGLLIGLVSALAYGFFPILTKRIPEKCNLTGILMYSFLVGAVYVFSMVDIKILLEALSLKMVIISVILGLIPTVLSCTFYSLALRYTTPTKAGIMSLVELPTAAIIGHFFLGEYLFVVNIIGIVVLLLGTVVSKIELPKKKNILVTGNLN
ncbi:DMT family transporter [Fusobacteria bacterium ZRK30]|nr:DMT family transporter [Fusobacteria bacterium ZRK30]